MKKLTSALLLTGATILCSYTLHAQNRFVNLKLETVSPTAGTVIANGGSPSLSYKLTNLGPDSVRVGDTLYITGNALNIPSNNVAGVPITQAIPPNASANLQFQAPNDVYTNNRTESTDTTLDLCLGIYTKFNVLDSTFNLRDTFTNDNQTCVSVTLKGHTGTGIAGVNGETVKAVVYPNPAHDMIKVDFTLTRKSAVSGHILDLTGRQVYQQDFGQQSPGTQTYTLKPEGLRPGLYIVELLTEGSRAIGRVNVQ